MEWIEEVQLKQGRYGSALATMDITEGSQGQAHDDHQKYWAARGETPLAPLPSPPAPVCTVPIMTHRSWPARLLSRVCVFWAPSSEPKIRKRMKRKQFSDTA